MSKWSAGFRDSRWQKKRLSVMERDGWKCTSCGCGEGVTLNVHHTYYERGRAPWEFEDDSLITLCETCHGLLSGAIKEISRHISFAPNINENIEALKNLMLIIADNFPATEFTNDTVEDLTEEELDEFLQSVEKAAEVACQRRIARHEAADQQKGGEQ